MASHIQDLHILIVDDDELLRELLVFIAQSLGVEQIATAADGSQALAYLKSPHNEVDIVFTDLNMPGMDGIEFLRYLIELEKEIKVVLVSAVHERVLKTAGELARAHGLKLLGLLPKPITVESLRELLERVDINTTGQSAGQISNRTLAAGLDAADLRHALARDEIQPYFQPKIDLDNSQVVGVESLARWIHPELGLVPCEFFIPIAESCELIMELTDIMITKSLKQAADWRRQSINFSVAINFSAHLLNRLELPDHLERMISVAGLDSQKIIIEITESDAVRDIPVALDVLTRLRMKGIGLAIDDFGTGYASTQQLKRIPFTELKIDRQFVHGAARDPATRAILESHINLAKTLHLTTVAEGVESREDWNLITQLGCDLAQGYYAAHPMPGDQLLDWYKNRNHRF